MHEEEAETWKVHKLDHRDKCEFMGRPYGCEVDVLAEVTFSRAEYKKVFGMVEEDRCLIEGCCKHFVFYLLGVRSVSEI